MSGKRKDCCHGKTALAFASGLLISLLFPQRCLLIIVAIIVIILAIALTKCC